MGIEEFKFGKIEAAGTSASAKPEEEKLVEEKGRAEEDSDKQIREGLAEGETEEHEILKNREEELAKMREELSKGNKELLLKEAILSLASESEQPEEELSPLIKEKKNIAEKRSLENIAKLLKNFFEMADDGRFIESEIGNAREALEILRQEVEKVRGSAFLTINLKNDTILKVLEDGRCKSILELSPDERRHLNPGYLERRTKDEEIMGTNAKGTAEDPYTIYGSLACHNGHDECRGGAEWGDIFLTLKPSVKGKCAFFKGDSMAVDADRLPECQLNSEHATIAKAILNIQNRTIFKGRDGSFSNYIEAHFLGGVKMKDVESINISNSKFLAGKYPDYPAYRESKETIRKIKDKYPQYADLIREL